MKALDVLAAREQPGVEQVPPYPRSPGKIRRLGGFFRRCEPTIDPEAPPAFRHRVPDAKTAIFGAYRRTPEIREHLLCSFAEELAVVHRYEVIPKKEWVELVVTEHEKGLLYVKGRLECTLEPGRHTFWTYPEAPVVAAKIDIRRFEVAIAGQELMTRDKVTLRLTLSVEYAVEDAALATTRVANLRDALYLAVQLAARDFVAGVTLDQLLEDRDAMTKYLESKVVPQAARFGVRVEAVGIKDVVLPGEMKTLLNRVIEAEKEAAANVTGQRRAHCRQRQEHEVSKRCSGAGIDYKRWQRIELGRVNLTVRTLVRVASALDASFWSLVERKKQPSGSR